MACVVYFIIVRERCAESTILSRSDLARFRGKTMSEHGAAQWRDIKTDNIDQYKLYL